MKTYQWIRVSKEHPCSVCGRFDWDTYCPELRLACCMRTPSPRQAGNGGYLHSMCDTICPPRPVRREVAPPPINVPFMLQQFEVGSSLSRLKELAERLTVSVSSLIWLGCVWSAQYQAFAFPMKDEGGKPIGIRLRYDNGQKLAVRGSHAGLFLPDCHKQQQLIIAEGPTDCAAALSMGYYAVGRPSCSGSVLTLRQFILRNQFRRAVICADNDPKERPDGTPYNPGLDGAQVLQQHLPIPSCICVVPAKDLREFHRNDGNRAVLDSMIKQLVFARPQP